MLLKHTSRRLSSRFIAFFIVLSSALVFGFSAQAAPPGFLPPELIAGGLANPTAMAFAPDGRLFVAQQAGALRVIDAGGNLLATPFITLTTTSVGERGLLGIAFDPNFASNGYVYLYYTVTTPTIHNRISRFTADPGNPNQALAASEVVLMELDTVTATDHNGGAMHFGPDGKLYIAIGDSKGGPTGLNAQDLNTTHGKILRINSDGSIPTDNPFYGTLTGIYRAIYAYGFRNPYTFAFQPGTGRLYANDVGEGAWEEINDVVAGGNYGWPYREANSPGLVTPEPPGFTYTGPIYQYDNTGGGPPDFTCAITGGTFYNNQVYQYPTTYLSDYFFGDFCAGFIQNYDTPTDTASPFYDTLGFGLVDLKTSPAGEIYFLTRDPFAGPNQGKVYRLRYEGAPEIIQNPQSVTVDEGQTATYTVIATGGQNLTYQWQKDGVAIPGATGASYTTPPTAPGDSGAIYTVIVSNGAFGSVASTPASLSVNPLPAVAQPSVGVFDPSISKIGFLVPGQLGVTGEQLEWVITVNNTSAVAGFNIVITDTLRDELRVDSVDLPVGTSNINGQTVTVTIPSLAPGQSVQFSIFTTVLNGEQIDNTACITADNMSQPECVSARAIRALPSTGETPWWRIWVMIGAFGSIALAIAGLGMLFVMDIAMQQTANIDDSDF